MYIKKIGLLNFQKIEKFTADFNGEGNVYFITGENELGKSTLLKAIGCLLTGERDNVLRDGADKGFAKMTVADDGEEFEVSLSYTQANPRGTLTVKQRSTGMQTNNISMLQKLFGYQDFDAVEFLGWSDTAEGRRRQIAVVKSLLPTELVNRLDGIDREAAAIKEQRTEVGREAKNLGSLVDESQRALHGVDETQYAEKKDLTSIFEAQREEAVRAERVNAAVRDLAAAKSRKDAALQDLEAAKKRCDELDKVIANLEDVLKTAPSPSPTDYTAEVAAAEEHNRLCGLVGKLRERQQSYADATTKYQNLTAQLASLADEKMQLMSSAPMPVNGLSFTDDGLELNGIPFVKGKISDSQSMEVAVKLAVAANKKVKVLRIARGESLGSKRLQDIIAVAKSCGFQGFIEQVQRGQDELRIEEYAEKQN